MIFNANGYLEPGFHPMSVAEIEAAFVTGFPFSSTRKLILAGYLKHSAEVQAIVGSFQEFLGALSPTRTILVMLIWSFLSTAIWWIIFRNPIKINCNY